MDRNNSNENNNEQFNQSITSFRRDDNIKDQAEASSSASEDDKKSIKESMADSQETLSISNTEDKIEKPNEAVNQNHEVSDVTKDNSSTNPSSTLKSSEIDSEDKSCAIQS